MRGGERVEYVWSGVEWSRVGDGEHGVEWSAYGMEWVRRRGAEGVREIVGPLPCHLVRHCYDLTLF